MGSNNTPILNGSTDGLQRFVSGACLHDCPDTCGILTTVENGRAVVIAGDPEHPITQGWLCAKVRPYLDHVYHPDRLSHPMRRVGPKGRWQKLSDGRNVNWTTPDALADMAGQSTFYGNRVWLRRVGK